MAVDQPQLQRASEAEPLRAAVSPPVFVAHGMQGFVCPEGGFLAALIPGQRLYVFELPGLSDGADPLRHVPGIAEACVRDLLARCGEEPVQIVAFCMGSLIGIEMARQLEARGRRPARLVLVEPHMPRPTMRLHESGRWDDAAALADIRSPWRWRRTETFARKTLLKLGRAGMGPDPRGRDFLVARVDAGAARAAGRMRAGALLESKMQAPP